jgi:hypothetical protein
MDNKKTTDKLIAAIQEQADLEKDYAFSRDTYHELIQVSIEAIQQLQQLSQDAEHPRAYEVLFNGIKHTADINGKLVDLQRKMQVIAQDGGTKQQEPRLLKEDDKPTIAFEGSTAELLSAIDNVRNEIIDADFSEPEED